MVAQEDLIIIREVPIGLKMTGVCNTGSPENQRKTVTSALRIIIIGVKQLGLNLILTLLMLKKNPLGWMILVSSNCFKFPTV